jgi:hypothetical protein
MDWRDSNCNLRSSDTSIGVPNLLKMSFAWQPTELPAPSLKSQKKQAEFGDPGRIRTCDPQLRRLVLYPAELRGLSPDIRFTRTAGLMKGAGRDSGADARINADLAAGVVEIVEISKAFSDCLSDPRSLAIRHHLDTFRR